MMLIVALCSLGGLLAGFIAGLFGIGGGTVLIPILLYILPKLGIAADQLMHQAAATSLAITLPTSLSSCIRHYQKRIIDYRILKQWLVFVAIGLMIAVFCFKECSTQLLQYIFIGYLIGCALYIGYQSRPNHIEKHKKALNIWSSSVGLLVGLFSILLGVGGGTVTIPYFLKQHYSMREAIEVSAITALFVGIVGALCTITLGLSKSGLSSFSIGYINLLCLTIIAPFSMLSAFFGAKISHITPEHLLRKMYIAFLLSVSVYTYVVYIQ